MESGLRFVIKSLPHLLKVLLVCGNAHIIGVQETPCVGMNCRSWKIALSYWSCNLSVMIVIPGMLGRLRDGPRQSFSQLFGQDILLDVCETFNVTLLHQTIRRAGPDKPSAQCFEMMLLAEFICTTF